MLLSSLPLTSTHNHGTRLTSRRTPFIPTFAQRTCLVVTHLAWYLNESTPWAYAFVCGHSFASWPARPYIEVNFFFFFIFQNPGKPIKPNSGWKMDRRRMAEGFIEAADTNRREYKGKQVTRTSVERSHMCRVSDSAY